MALTLYEPQGDLSMHVNLLSVHVVLLLTCEKLVLYVKEMLGSSDGMHIHAMQPSINEDPLAPPQAPPQHRLWVLLIYLEIG